MKKLLLSCIVLLSAVVATANNGLNAKFMSKSTSAATNETVEDYGFLTTPDGASWTYTAAYRWTDDRISGVEVSIYDEEKNLVGKLNEDFELLETDLWIRNVTINSLITKTFFNRDANYEIMLWVDIATKDFKGRFVNNIYSLADTASVYVCSVEGTYLMAKNTSTFSNDNYTMVFWRQEYQGDTLYYNYDVYNKATIGTVGPKLAHTFVVPYQHIAALNDPMPLMMFQEGTELSYIVSMYEKPYFVPGTSIYEDPVINEDNHFIITHYDSKFNVTLETKIPMVKDPSDEYLYSFYYLGSLDGQNDVIKNYNGTGKMAYVITVDNYEISSDGSVYSYYLYDATGNRIGIIEEHSLRTIYLSDVPGQSKQYAFLKIEDEQEKVVTVDVPSCERVADIPLYNGGNTLSGQWDRLPYGDSYRYVSPLLQGDNAEDGSVLQRIAWFNKNGRLLHYDTINLGEKIEYAQLYIYAPVLNPRIFDYDDAYEYMALVKRTKSNSSSKEEALLICNNKGEILLQLGEDETKGSLSTIDVINISTNPTLFCSYNNKGQYTIDLIPLPLSKNILEGEGTPDLPYKISSVEDWLQIGDNPSAYYEVINDIDFANIPVTSLKGSFSGSIDGNQHAFYNLCLHGGGLFDKVIDTVVIQNLKLNKPILVLSQGDALVAGILANTLRGGYAEGELSDESVEYHATVRNIHLISPTIQASSFTGQIGGLVGDASLFSSVQESSLTNSTIVAPVAEVVGGVVGTLATSSSTQALLFTGEIDGGHTVGGIVGAMGSDDSILNCHVDAHLSALNVLGGIVGSSNRAKISQSLVEGTLALSAGDISKPGVGGIVGFLKQDAVGSQTDPVIENCLVAITDIQYPSFMSSRESNVASAHRIVGFSSVNEYEYDWDNIDYNQPQDQWPRIYGKTEKCLQDNYVISSLPVLDATIDASHTSTEGATLPIEQMTTSWLEEHGFAFGQTIDSPWVFNSTLQLWYEVDGTISDVQENPIVPEWVIENGNLNVNGSVKVYNLHGMLLIEGRDYVEINQLPKGLYIISVTNNESNTVQKVFLR